MMRTLLYKRTHKGDPSEDGEFGCSNCMSRVRLWPFDSVIGVGGQGVEPIKEGIAFKLNWIGIGAHKVNSVWRYPNVIFDRFILWEALGEELEEFAPNLAKLLYVKKIRATLKFTDAQQVEIDKILEMAKNSPPSKMLSEVRVVRKRICKLKRYKNPFG